MWRNAYGQVTGIIGIELTLARSWPRRARYFWLDPKVSKKSSQQIGFFSLKSFALLQLFCPPSPTLTQRFCKNLLCPFLRTGPPLFCPFSPEAYLLTGTCFFNVLWVELNLCTRPAIGSK
jgi:hypothetical protein